MDTMDLFEDGFPHSTREGYEAGCRGSACMGKLEHGFSCSEAHVRYAGDYAYRKLVDGGATPAEIAEADAADRAAAAPEPRKKKRERVVAPELDVASVVEVAEVDAAAVGGPAEAALGALVEEGLSRAGAAMSTAVDALVAVSKPKRGRAPGSIEHGTAYGYQRGCRDGLACPKNADGVSCHEAYRAYQRDYAERRRAAGGALGSRKGMRRTDRIEVATAEVVEMAPVEADVVLPPSRAVLLPTVEELQSDLAVRDARIAELEEQLVAARAAAWSTLIERVAGGATVLRVEVLGGAS